jgi:hypothetical protein
MDFVKLKTTYYNDLAVRAAGEQAEVLFTRGLAFAGEQETDGFIPSWAPAALTSSKATARVNALVREGLWTKVDGGWHITGWDKHQVSKAEVETKRELGRLRQAKHREKTKQSRVTERVTNASVTQREEEEEVDAAAAASRETLPQPLPAALEILRAKLDARKLAVRWDKLKPDQVAQIEQLIELHGDTPLVRAALQSFRPDSPPAFVQAWLETWRTLPQPGRLEIVAPPCDLPGHVGTTAHCTQCASERIAAR